LDVIVPKGATGPLPVYVYFHGGGWTSGDKAPLTRYCASQATAGMVVVNVNYRMAPRHRMEHMMLDASAALAWVARNIADFGGDPHRVVLGGDSAGGQIAGLTVEAMRTPELARHYRLPRLHGVTVRGTVQHCSALDFSVIFERGFILGLGFVRMLLPGRPREVRALREAARHLSPIEWVDAGTPPVLITTSLKDPFYRANLNYIAQLRRHGVPVDVHIDDEAQHTWQQDSRHPGSRSVYERIADFVSRVTGGVPVSH
jgi:acetyl esterase/lipase